MAGKYEFKCKFIMFYFEPHFLVISVLLADYVFDK